ncbi:transmembrane amino acid transporter protein-domain-containing protein [Mycotypha africana]|uniref:transmembrane amino acid transporter protein-domain-containing protein n=1 Tax=Mycotypha africana TaxID=64632 RepID=UPI002301E3FB|nr:transmembrane amino acid transporter protein-domain-containing protein [Mycotypha africana]KAI8975790.1 transmembrane amino acid transporter protein-domain-containing protein [Mycotypha africana]
MELHNLSNEKSWKGKPTIDQITDSVVGEETDHEIISFSHGVDRDTEGGSSFLAYFNVVCVVAGTGALSLPYALKQGGWIDSGIVLIRSLYYNGRTRLSSYQEVAEAAFGKIGGWISFFFTAVTLIGVPVLYILLAGQNIHSLCMGTAGELTFALWVIICTVVVAIPFIFFKSMKEVGFLSAFGMLCTVIVVLIVLVMAVKDKPNQINVHHDNVIWDQFPIALSSIVFSFGGNPVYAHVEAGMRHPQNWNKVILAGLSTCSAIYFLTAIPGYYVYGNQAQSPIYNSIPEGGAKIASEIIITLHVLMAVPILLTSFALDLEKMFGISSFNHSRPVEFLLRFTLRMALMVIICVLAIFVPFFGDFMSLLGAFSNCALILIFPVLFYLKLTGIRNKHWAELFLCFFVVLLGIVGLIFGTKSAIEALISDFANQ